MKYSGTLPPTKASVSFGIGSFGWHGNPASPYTEPRRTAEHRITASQEEIADSTGNPAQCQAGTVDQAARSPGGRLGLKGAMTLVQTPRLSCRSFTIKFRMEQQGLFQRASEPKVGAQLTTQIAVLSSPWRPHPLRTEAVAHLPASSREASLFQLPAYRSRGNRADLSSWLDPTTSTQPKPHAVEVRHIDTTIAPLFEYPDA